MADPEVDIESVWINRQVDLDFRSKLSVSGGSRIFPGGRQHMISPNFPENCMKSKEFGCTLGGGSSVDPGFPRGEGGHQLPGGRQHTILPNFPENCMKLKEFGYPGAPP